MAPEGENVTDTGVGPETFTVIVCMGICSPAGMDTPTEKVVDWPCATKLGNPVTLTPTARADLAYGKTSTRTRTKVTAAVINKRVKSGVQVM